MEQVLKAAPGAPRIDAGILLKTSKCFNGLLATGKASQILVYALKALLGKEQE